MLFNYKYIENHTIYTLQKWIDELFDFWCKADPKVDYDIDLLPNDIKEITKAIYYDDNRITTDYLYGPIERIYNIFQSFDQKTKNKLIKAYKNNNNIEDLCKNKNKCSVLHYSDIKKINQELSEELIKFHKSLFTDVIGLKCVTDKIGKIDNHYDEFVSLNDEGKCPFCGFNDIKSQYSSKREAYDHFLPKDLYPFNSINFKNLAPMCHECNSSYKLKADPLYKKDKITRRKAFYPFDKVPHPNISLKISFNKNEIDKLSPNDIQLIFSSKGKNEEIESWLEVFGIEERFKEKCIVKNYGKYWYLQATEEYDSLPEEVKQIYPKSKWIDKQINEANKNLYANANFIKIGYLEAYKRIQVL